MIYNLETILKAGNKCLTAYLSGPISGKTPEELEVFAKAQEVLEKAGITVVNPLTIPHPRAEELRALRPTAHELSFWVEYMRDDIAAAMSAGCDIIVMLPGWEDSEGACIERQLFDALGLGITEYREGMEV